MITRVEDRVKIENEDGSYLFRIGEVWKSGAGGVLFRRVGLNERFDQMGPSKSLRRDRVRIKEMVRAAS